MFGYVLPYKEKLSPEAWGLYRSSYCGLCHTLGKRYGFPARFLLNYDFTFLSVLLRREESAPCVSCRRCISGPFKGRTVRERDPALEAAADGCVLLAYWQAKDKWRDERGLGALPGLAMLVGLYPVFRRARRHCPDLDREIGTRLSQLGALEREGCASLDRTADRFASLMTLLVPQDWPEADRRELEQLLYHLGRWIYLVDAWDDLEEDLRRGRYNPIAARFSLTAQSAPEEREAAREQVRRTVGHSENLTISAFHLGAYGYSAPVVENVLCAGLRSVGNMVFSGTWKKACRQKKQELNHYHE